MKKIRRVINKIFNRSAKIYYPGIKKTDLIIYDDFFPNPISGFRMDEFSYLLNNIPSSRVIVNSERTYKLFGYQKETRLNDINNFLSKQGKYLNRRSIQIAKKFNNINCKLVYVLFYNNLLHVYNFLEFFKIPFVITLYPGGGFVIKDTNTDKALKKMLSSILCKGVIVNQTFTKKYLIKKQICEEKKIKLIYGLPISDEKLNFDLELKKYYPEGKKQLDICFVGAKYSYKGMDKGYDLFIDVAKKLKFKYNHIIFHVIGGFNETDIDIKQLGESIKFYGEVKSNKLRDFLSGFDVIIAPNRSNVISEGSFDGFPVGCCVEASLVGCCMVTTDPMSENLFYEEGKEIFIVEPDAEYIFFIIEDLVTNPEKPKRVGEAGMKKTQLLYSSDNQLKERELYLKGIINTL